MHIYIYIYIHICVNIVMYICVYVYVLMFCVAFLFLCLLSYLLCGIMCLCCLLPWPKQSPQGSQWGGAPSCAGLASARVSDGRKNERRACGANLPPCR